MKAYFRNRVIPFFSLGLLVVGITWVSVARSDAAGSRDPTGIEVVEHTWSPDKEWIYIGKTKYIWRVTVRNNSDVRKRVFVYYYLLDADDVPLARNVANKYVGPHQTIEIKANSYIMTPRLPRVTKSRVTLKVGFPN